MIDNVLVLIKSAKRYVSVLQHCAIELGEGGVTIDWVCMPPTGVDEEDDDDDDWCDSKDMANNSITDKSNEIWSKARI